MITRSPILARSLDIDPVVATEAAADPLALARADLWRECLLLTSTPSTPRMGVYRPHVTGRMHSVEVQ